MYSLITGASSGIGLELAKVFSENKKDVVLLARSKLELEKLAQELRLKYQNNVQVLCFDLADRDAAKEIYKIVQNKKWEIDTLVNNAGFGEHSAFCNSDWKRLADMIQVNITSLTELTHLFLPEMLKNKSGKILNVASTAAFQPGPFFAVYYATKAFVLSFSSALNEELLGSGVSVTALCPGPTQSGFQKASHMKDTTLFKLKKVPTSRQVAEFAYLALEKKQAIAIHGLTNRIGVFLNRLLPRQWILKIVRRLQGIDNTNTN